jgi:hypothetical protein
MRIALVLLVLAGGCSSTKGKTAIAATLVVTMTATAYAAHEPDGSALALEAGTATTTALLPAAVFDHFLYKHEREPGTPGEYWQLRSPSGRVLHIAHDERSDPVDVGSRRASRRQGRSARLGGLWRVARRGDERGARRILRRRRPPEVGADLAVGGADRYRDNPRLSGRWWRHRLRAHT